MERKSGGLMVSIGLLVLIGAILAAAVAPGVIEAEIRKKLAQAKSDMADIGRGLEAYHVDHNSYPNDTEYGWTWYPTYTLTTPIKYVSGEKFIDPFEHKRQPSKQMYWKMYRYINYEANDPDAPWKSLPNSTWRAGVTEEEYRVGLAKYGYWRLSSVGPDGSCSYYVIGSKERDIADPGPGPWGSWFGLCMVYDPTNGMISCGDVMHCYETGEVTSVAAPKLDMDVEESKEKQ